MNINNISNSIKSNRIIPIKLFALSLSLLVSGCKNINLIPGNDSIQSTDNNKRFQELTYSLESKSDHSKTIINLLILN